jgi:hypothetical protein
MALMRGLNKPQYVGFGGIPLISGRLKFSRALVAALYMAAGGTSRQHAPRVLRR